jgi:putative endonuclease
MSNKGYMYILECANGSYYTGSTHNIEKRLFEHQQGLGANFTKKRLPVKLVYTEEYDRIDEAFAREKQVQGWRREKKEALIRRDYKSLPMLASTSYPSAGYPSAGSGSATNHSTCSTSASSGSATDSKSSLSLSKGTSTQKNN